MSAALLRRGLRACAPPRCSLPAPLSARLGPVAYRARTHVAHARPGEEDGLLASGIDLRVGKILSCELHPDADSLYVEKIDVGEEEPRSIISGLVEFVPIEQMQERKVVVVCNLKARNMRGVRSHGMVLCASDEKHENVEPLVPPEGAEIGERLFFEENQRDPETENRVQKKKIWDIVQSELETNDDGVVIYQQDYPLMSTAGAIKAPTLKGAMVS